MADLESFDDLFSFDSEYEYDVETIEAIQQNRRELENELFFDRLLKLLQLSQLTEKYPPQSNDDLRNMHLEIVMSTAPDHHKQSLLYYILLDYSADPEVAAQFVRDSYLPDQYATLMQGLWYMDHLEFPDALEMLTQPNLIPTFPEEILLTLVRHAPLKDFSLPLAYYHTVSPALTTPKAVKALFTAICNGNISDAFHFARSQTDRAHKHLFEQLIYFVHSQPPSSARAEQSVELINQPFDTEEEQWFMAYLTTGEARNLQGAKASVATRRIATGRYSEALGVDKSSSGYRAGGHNWETLLEGLKHGLGPRTARAKYVGVDQ